MSKILIVIPTFENITPDTFKSIYNLHKPCACDFDFVRGYDCATARNNIARRALNWDYDYVFMVDSDIILPNHALTTLLQDHHDKDVVVGYYPKHTGQRGETCVYKLGEYNFTQAYTIPELKEHADPELSASPLIQIHGAGMGCALIKTIVFEKINYPWFDWVNYKDGGNLSEDLYFCKRCKETGIDIFVDTRVGCGHIVRGVRWE